jgi:hypothetical protein
MQALTTIFDAKREFIFCYKKIFNQTLRRVYLHYV